MDPEEEMTTSSREQWENLYKFRSINLREFEDRILGFDNDEKLAANKIEISIPIFLRQNIQTILSIGKSVKIIRYIEGVNADLEVQESLPTELYETFRL